MEISKRKEAVQRTTLAYDHSNNNVDKDHGEDSSLEAADEHVTDLDTEERKKTG